MRRFDIKEIGQIVSGEGNTYIQVKKEFISGLREIERFGHVNIIWQLDDWGDERFRNQLEVSSLWEHGLRIMGTFSTRTPERPNPVAPDYVWNNLCRL